MIEKNIRSAALIKEKAARELPRAALSIDYEIGLPAGIHVLDAVALVLEGSAVGADSHRPAAVFALRRRCYDWEATPTGSRRVEPWREGDACAYLVSRPGADW